MHTHRDSLLSEPIYSMVLAWLVSQKMREKTQYSHLSSDNDQEFTSTSTIDNEPVICIPRSLGDGE